MGRLFNRVWSVTVSTLDVSDFHVHFRIEKTTKPEPNKALVEIWNLSEDHRGALGEIVPGKRVAKKKRKGKVSPNLKGVIPVRIEAGYLDDGPQQVFLGDLRTCDSELSSPDWITAITSGDGERAYRTARINQAFGAGTPVPVALKGLVTALGLGPGNIAKVTAGLKLGGTATLLARGVVFSGPVVRHLTDLCRSANLEWSVQDGVVQFVDVGQALAGQAVVLSASTGLIGSPNVDGDGVLKAETLMIPGLGCGRLVIVDSKMVQGQFRVEKIVTEGDSHGKTWGHTIEAKRY
jgi:hypothetical protein